MAIRSLLLRVFDTNSLNGFARVFLVVVVAHDLTEERERESNKRKNFTSCVRTLVLN